MIILEVQTVGGAVDGNVTQHLLRDGQGLVLWDEDANGKPKAVAEIMAAPGGVVRLTIGVTGQAVRSGAQAPRT